MRNNKMSLSTQPPTTRLKQIVQPTNYTDKKSTLCELFRITKITEWPQDYDISFTLKRDSKKSE